MPATSAAPDPPPPGAPRALGALVWIATALVFLAFRLPFFDLPLERDEGEYAYIAQRWLGGGFVPYRDAFDQKPPAIFLAYGAALLAGGESVRAIRLFHLAWMAATTLAVGRLGSRLAGPAAGAFSAFAFAALSASPALLGGSANTEMFLGLPMVASLLAALRARESGRLRHWVAAGALAGAAALFKQVAGLHGLFVLGLALASAPRASDAPGAPTHARVAAAVLGGAFLVAAPVVLYFAATRSLGAFLDATVVHNLGYSTSVPFAKGMRTLAGELARQAPSFAATWLLALLALATPFGLDRERRQLLGLWLGVCFAALSVGFYYREHYFVVWLPPLCVLAGSAAAAVLHRAALVRPTFATLATLALLAWIAAPPALANRAWLWSETPDQITRRLYGKNPFPESPEIARLLRERSAPGESVFVVGSEPQILFLADRPSATRYILSYPLVGGSGRASLRQKEAMDEVRRARPRCVVLVRVPASYGVGEKPPSLLFRDTLRLLRDGYALEAVWITDDAGGYRTLVGDEARAHGDRIKRRRGDAPAIAVYRREDPVEGSSAPGSGLPRRVAVQRLAHHEDRRPVVLEEEAPQVLADHAEGEELHAGDREHDDRQRRPARGQLRVAQLLHDEARREAEPE